MTTTTTTTKMSPRSVSSSSSSFFVAVKYSSRRAQSPRVPGKKRLRHAPKASTNTTGGGGDDDDKSGEEDATMKNTTIPAEFTDSKEEEATTTANNMNAGVKSPYEKYRLASPITTLTDMPYDGGCSACSLSASSSDFIYVFVHGNCVLRYDTSADSYVELCKLPVKEWYTFDVCHAGERNKRSIIVFGGAICGKSADRVFKFDVLTLEWTELSKMTEKRRRLAACVCSFEADKTS